MRLSNLPNELLTEICAATPIPDLLVAARTCSWLSPVATRAIYRHVHVTYESQALLVLLSSRADLAASIRSFSVTMQNLSSPPCTSTYQYLASALLHMSELTSLDVYLDSHHSWILPLHKPFLQLSRFSCSFGLDSNVVQFLEQTPNLKSLALDDYSVTPASPLRAMSISHLNLFRGSTAASHAVIPGRPIYSAELTAGDLGTDLDYLSRSTTPIVILSATTSIYPAPLLRSLATYLPSVKYLRISTTYKFPSASAPEFYQQTAEALAMTNLNTFELCGMHWFSEVKGEKSRVWQSQAPPSVAEDVEFDHFALGC